MKETKLSKELRQMSELYAKLSPNGLLPPQAIEFEQSLLGAMLVSKESCGVVFATIGQRSADDTPFYRPAHSIIYFAMLELASRDEPIDPLTLSNQLRLDGQLEAIGGPLYIVDLTRQVVTTVNVESHARVILEMYIAREVIRIGQKSSLLAFEGETDAFDLLDQTLGELMAAGGVRGRSGLRHARSDWQQLWKNITTPAEDGMRGLPTGIEDFDEMMRGLRVGEQTVLAAITSRGKTALAVQIVREHLDRGGWCAVFTLETSGVNILLRYLAGDTGIDSTDLATGEIGGAADWLELKNQIGRLERLPLYLDDSGSRTPFDIRTELRRIQKKHTGDGLVVVDYLQLVDGVGKFDTREREVTSVSRQLRAIWKDLNVAGLVLAQFNRNADDNREPSLRDFRESSAIEQDARAVIFIHYPFRSQETTIPRVETVHLILAKNDGGQVGKVECDFHKHLGRFTRVHETFDSVAKRRSLTAPPAASHAQDATNPDTPF